MPRPTASGQRQRSGLDVGGISLAVMLPGIVMLACCLPVCAVMVIALRYCAGVDQAVLRPRPDAVGYWTR